jgi:hypothetical protein
MGRRRKRTTSIRRVALPFEKGVAVARRGSRYHGLRLTGASRDKRWDGVGVGWGGGESANKRRVDSRRASTGTPSIGRASRNCEKADLQLALGPLLPRLRLTRPVGVGAPAKLTSAAATRS